MEEDLEQVGFDPGNETPDAARPLEEKYKQQMRQIMSQKIELPISALAGMIENQITLNPEFQRRDRWDVERQSRFIESIIMNVPVPPVFLGEETYGGYTVLDGRQRLTAIYEFLRNNYSLKGLSVWSELNKDNIRALEKKGLDVMLFRRFLPAVLILKESSPQVKYDVFDRLNTGGVVANAMEIRNAVYPGPFNRVLHSLSDQSRFRQLWKIPSDNEARLAHALYMKMYDLELVLRFLALRTPKAMDLSFKDFLSDFMEERNRRYEVDSSLETLDRAVFERATENCWTVFGAQAFQKPGSKLKSAPLADAEMQALSDVDPEKLDKATVEAICGKMAEAQSADADFLKAISTGTNGKGAIVYRIEKAKEIVSSCLP
ncbi:MAG: DUF262 domain-containing protein [Chthoniobacterales bacterium]|nr:DUF262 domain-containing protein [Chthoniobacterales bacterium]